MKIKDFWRTKVFGIFIALIFIADLCLCGEECLAAEYMIYSEGGNICDYITGEGSYFDVRREFYSDSDGNIVYCLQAGTKGAVESGTAGYSENNVDVVKYDDLMGKLRNISYIGYPSAFGEFKKDVDGKTVTTKGLMINNTLYECNENEARAVTSFVIHKTISDYYAEKGINDINKIEVKSYRNGPLAKHNLTIICDAMFEKVNSVNTDHNVTVAWGIISDGKFYEGEFLGEEISKYDERNVVCGCARITSDNCYVSDVSLIDDGGYIAGGIIREIKFLDYNEKLVCFEIPYEEYFDGKQVGIRCNATTGNTNARFLGNESYQDVMIVPNKRQIEIIDEKGSKYGELSIYKKDYDTGKPLKGVTFGVYSDKACDLLYAKIKTDEEGFASLKDIRSGRYYIKELECPKGYVLDKTVYDVEISPGGVSFITVSNKRCKLDIYVVKEDAETGEIPQGDANFKNAIYGLYVAEDFSYMEAGVKTTLKKDDLICKLKLDEFGRDSVSGLYPGKYYLKELKAPEGYLLSDDEYYIDATDISEADSNTSIIKKEIVVKDFVKKSAFSIYKFAKSYNGKNKVFLQGAGFMAWKYSDVSLDEFGNYIFDVEKAVTLTNDGGKELFTDDEGYAKSIELPYGKYIVDETTVPYGMVKADPFAIDINEDSREPLKPVNVEDYIVYRGKLGIKKVLEEKEWNQIILDDINKITFSLYAADDISEYDYSDKCEKNVYLKDELIETVDIATAGDAQIADLPVGDYYLVEESTIDGYVRYNEPIYVNITPGNDCNPDINIMVEVENLLTYIEVEKRDYETMDIVEGAKLCLMDEAGNVIERWVSGTNAHVIKGLMVGKEYILVEEEAPKDYLVAEDIRFTVLDNTRDNPLKIVMKDRRERKTTEETTETVETTETTEETTETVETTETTTEYDRTTGKTKVSAGSKYTNNQTDLSKDKKVQTGDKMNVLMVVIIMILSLLGLYLVVKKSPIRIDKSDNM